MRIRLLMILVGGIVTLTGSAEAKGSRGNSSPYFPLAVGNEWIYSVEWFFGEFSRVDTIRIGGKVTVKGQTYYHLSTPWSPVYTTWVRADASGDLHWCEGPGEPEHPLLLFSVEPGEGWLLGGRHCVDSAVRLPTPDPIETPLGTFEGCVRLGSWKRPVDCTDGDWRGYFASGVGPVKWEMYGAGVVFEWHLIGMSMHPACRCPARGRPVWNAPPTVRDVIDVIDVLFGGQHPAETRGCSDWGRALHEWTDVDCSGTTDVVDLALMIEVAFFGADPAVSLCAPCTH